MDDELSHGEIQELLGAYALGAVDERERAIVEAHREICESCRAELDEHRRLAVALRRHAPRVSPLASVESNGSARTSGPAARAGAGRRWIVPAATAVVVVSLGGLFAQGQIRGRDLEATMNRVELLERAQLAAADPAAVVTTLRTPGDEPVLTVVSRTVGGASYAMNSTVPRLADGHTYQLWRVDNQGVAAAATLGRRPDTIAFALPSGVTGFLLTVETGSAPNQPSLPAVATGRTSS